MSMRTPGASFFTGALGGNTFTTDASTGETVLAPSAVTPVAANLATNIRGQKPERVFTHAPKFWKVTNRAIRGHVVVWMDGFDGVTFPEGAGEDKSTWLQPGAEMLIPIEAGLHFFGNVFDPRVSDAMAIIEKTGGFELEPQDNPTPKNASVSVVGPPIGLPDFIIEPIDGRMRRVGEPIALYDLYWNAVKKRVLKPRRQTTPAVLEQNTRDLEDRFEMYAPDRPFIVDENGAPLVSGTRVDMGDEADEYADLPDMAEAPSEEEHKPKRGRAPVPA